MSAPRNTARKDDGTFAEYAVVRPEFQMKIPDHLTYEEASTLASGLIPVVRQSLVLALDCQTATENHP